MKRSPIRKVSKRLSSGLSKYAKAKKEYLDKHLACERCCKYGILQIHHKKSRLGSLLWDKKNFAALCQSCHAFAHSNPKEAREEGWMIDRLAIRNHSYE